MTTHPSAQKPSAPSSPVETAVVWMLAVATVTAPVILGCSGIWWRFALEATIAVATIAWALSGPRLKSMMLLPLAAVILALLQTTPLPEWLLVRVAPVSAGAWKVAHGGPSAVWSSISVDPSATMTAMRRLLLALCVVAVVADLGRRQSYRKRLLWALALSGTVMLTAGIIFGPAKKHRLLGFVNLAGPLVPDTNPMLMPVQTNGVGKRTTITVGNLQYEIDEGNVGDGFGTYIYSNHFGGGVNLTFPVLLAGCFLAMRQRVPTWALWMTAIVALAGVVWLVGGVAQSRAGAGSLALGGLLMMAIVAETKLARWATSGLLITYATALAAVAGLMTLLLFQQAQGILDLLPAPWKASVVQNLADSRIVAAQVALRMTAASPLLGTGLETYETVFPRFQTSPFTLFYAHNDYAQVLAETGLVGAAIAIAVACVLVRRCTRFYLQAKGDYRILNAGAWAALAGIGLHTGLDWNLHLPANAFLACIVTGLCASSVPTTPWRATQYVLQWLPDWIPRAILVSACILSAALLARDATSDHVQRLLREAIVLDRLDPSKPEHRQAEAALTAALARAQKMAVWDSRNPRLLLLTGQANLHLARQAQSGSTQSARLGAAEMCFLKARQASASLRGLPAPAATAAR